MSKALFLPNEDDWKNLNKMEKRFEVFNHSFSNPEFINPTHLRILIILSRQILEKRPMTKEEISDVIINDGLQYFSNYEEIDLSYDDSKLNKKDKDIHLKKQIRIIMDILTKMKSHNQVDVLKKSDWNGSKIIFNNLQQKNKQITATERTPERNFALYKMTAKGVIQYELSLILPLFSINFSNLNTRFRIQDAHINWGIASMKNRYRWNREFLNQMNFCVSDFHQEVFLDIEKTLGKEKDFFWKICTPQVLILREYSNMRATIDYLKSLKMHIGKRHHIGSEDNKQVIEYEKSIVSNYINSIDSTIANTESIIERILLPFWSDTLDLKIKELKLHGPKPDIVTNS